MSEYYSNNTGYPLQSHQQLRHHLPNPLDDNDTEHNHIRRPHTSGAAATVVPSDFEKQQRIKTEINTVKKRIDKLNQKLLNANQDAGQDSHHHNNHHRGRESQPEAASQITAHRSRLNSPITPKITESPAPQIPQQIQTSHSNNARLNSANHFPQYHQPQQQQHSQQQQLPISVKDCLAYSSDYPPASIPQTSTYKQSYQNKSPVNHLRSTSDYERYSQYQPHAFPPMPVIPASAATATNGSNSNNYFYPAASQSLQSQQGLQSMFPSKKSHEELVANATSRQRVTKRQNTHNLGSTSKRQPTQHTASSQLQSHHNSNNNHLNSQSKSRLYSHIEARTKQSIQELRETHSNAPQTQDENDFKPLLIQASKHRKSNKKNKLNSKQHNKKQQKTERTSEDGGENDDALREGDVEEEAEEEGKQQEPPHSEMKVYFSKEAQRKYYEQHPSKSQQYEQTLSADQQQEQPHQLLDQSRKSRTRNHEPQPIPVSSSNGATLAQSQIYPNNNYSSQQQQQLQAANFYRQFGARSPVTSQDLDEESAAGAGNGTAGYNGYSTAQPQSNKTSMYGGNKKNILDIANSFLSSPLMQQFNDEYSATGGYYEDSNSYNYHPYPSDSQYHHQQQQYRPQYQNNNNNNNNNNNEEEDEEHKSFDRYRSFDEFSYPYAAQNQQNNQHPMNEQEVFSEKTTLNRFYQSNNGANVAMMPTPLQQFPSFNPINEHQMSQNPFVLQYSAQSEYRRVAGGDSVADSNRSAQFQLQQQQQGIPRVPQYSYNNGGSAHKPNHSQQNSGQMVQQPNKYSSQSHVRGGTHGTSGTITNPMMIGGESESMVMGEFETRSPQSNYDSAALGAMRHSGMVGQQAQQQRQEEMFRESINNSDFTMPNEEIQQFFKNQNIFLK